MIAASVVRGPVRAARAATFALVTVLLAAVAHVTAGGPIPDVVLVLVLALPVAAIGFALAGRRPGVVVLLGALGATQLALHQCFMTFAGMDALHPAAMGSTHHEVGARAEAGAPTVSILTGTPMLVAHLVAVFVLALLLVRGDHVLAVLLNLAGSFLGRARRDVVTLPLPWTALTIHCVSLVPTTPGIVLPVGRRGPP